MGYTPLSIKPGKARTSTATSFMSSKGLNKRDLPQLLNTDFAQVIQNYIIVGDGQLQKRKGLERLFAVAGTNPITMLEQLSSNIIVFGFAQTVSVYNILTDTITVVKSDWVANDGFEGAGYGDYFFMCNGIERVYRFSQALAYDAQTADFNVGAIVTGGTSGATAVILEDNDAGVTGTLTLGEISGTFQNDEALTDDGTVPAAAAADGIITYPSTELTESPLRTQLVRPIGARLFAGASSSVHYTSIDDETNPPFSNWTPITTLADGPGRIDNKIGGTVRAIEPFGQDIVVFQDEGKYAFFINQIDSAGTLSRVDVFRMSRFDFGGARGAQMTSQGLLYVNEAGLWQLVSIGTINLPLSDQEGLTSVLLGNTFFDDVTTANADIIEDRKNKLILLSVAKNSATNNTVLAWHYEQNKAFTQFVGWGLNRFMKIGETLYGGSSINTRVYELFKGSSDDTLNIGTVYRQEIKLGNLETRQILEEFYIQGFLSPSTLLIISFDIYDVSGIPRNDKKRYTWSAQYNLNASDGFGTAAWGGSAWGGDIDFGNLIESFDGIRPFIRNFQRLIVEITGGDALPHAINWFSAGSKIKAKIRRRRLVELT